MKKIYKFFVFAILLFTSTLFAQEYTITGVVTSVTSKEKLIGANVFLQGTDLGAATNIDGKYKIVAPKGHYTITASYIGFNTQKVKINLTNNMELNFSLKNHIFTLSITVIADRALNRETPVAFSNIRAKKLKMSLGSRDLPMVLNSTPSVYATEQGGGAGDARINVRGFNQRNVAVMINGIPVNDMENGWLYWSDWSSMGDVTSSIQVQRGLSAVNLATPSIGGTINIITDPSALKFGIKFRQEFGSGTFLKSTLTANTGLINNKWAFSVMGVRNTGKGVIDKTWQEGWAYYLASSYNINSKNRLELDVIGGPQMHGQNLYRQNIAAYSHSYAKKLGYTAAELAAFKQSSAGRFYNENWNTVNPSYKGKQYWNGSTHTRYASGYIGERVNYYNKPVVNLNWYSQLNNRLSWYNIIYYSGGSGGGSGMYGYPKWDYNSQPSRIVNWNATIAKNDTSTKGSVGIIRNSVNTQYTLGAISKGYYKVSDELKTSFGLDWRHANINHFREVRDLLGGSYFIFKGNQFDSPSQYRKLLGDKIDYYSTNTVDWLGLYGQGEYTKGKVTAFGMYGWSTVKYSYTNHFKKDASGNQFVLKSDQIPGFQVKGGASYRVSYNVDVYGNIGYVSKVPIFDNVIDDVTDVKLKNRKNEKFTSVEGGINYRSLSGKLTAKVDYYYTIWKNQAYSVNVLNPDGTSGVVSLHGMNSLHTGIEFQGAFQPIKLFRIDAAGSIGNWKYLDDVSGLYKNYKNGVGTVVPYHFYVKDLKVGDAPQSQLALAGTIFPINGLSVELSYNYYANYYANWSPFTRNKITDVGQVWKTPAYSLFNLNLLYNLPFDFKNVHFQLFAHVFNLFNTIYIQDATDDSRYNAVRSAPLHTAQRAEVFLGLPRSVNLGITLNY